MYCKNCGKPLSEDASMYCPYCGAKLTPMSNPAPEYTTPNNSYNGTVLVNNNVHTFGQAIRSCFQKYACFEGRACRAEYWFFYLFNALLSVFGCVGGTLIAIGSIDLAYSLSIGGSYHTTAFYVGVVFLIIYSLIVLAMLLPNLAVIVRRLHDSGKSGWFILLSLIPYAGAIVMLVFMCLDSDENTNEWGTNPNTSPVAE